MTRRTPTGACSEQDFDSQQEGLAGGSDYDDVLARWHWAG